LALTDKRLLGGKVQLAGDVSTVTAEGFRYKRLQSCDTKSRFSRIVTMTIMLRSYLLYGTILLSLSLLSGCSKEAKKNRLLSQGAKEFQSGAYDTAKITYMKVLRLDQGNATAYARLGQIWLEEGAPLRAGAFLKQAEELSPADLDNRLRLARVYLSLGETTQAKKRALAVLQQAPTKGEALVFLSEMARTPDDIRDTEQVIEKFHNKQTASYQLATANLALRKKNPAAAEKAVREAVALDPKSAEAHQAIAILNLYEKKPKEAAKELQIAAELAPLRSNIRIAYADYMRQTEGGEKAIAFLRDLTAKAPDFLPAWTLLGRIAFNQKKYDEALAFLENVVSRDAQNIDARLLRSDIWLAKKETKKAITELEKLATSFPGLPAAKYRLAQAYLQENKPSQSAAALDEALLKNPNYTEAILARAELNLRAGHAQEAIDALERLHKKHPDFRAAQILLADAYRASGRFDDAADIFREQIKATPNVPEPYLFLGLIQVQQNSLEGARHSFEKVLELSPDNLMAVDQLINLDVTSNDLAAATRRVEEQLKNHPDRAASFVLQGRIQIARKDWKEAEASLKKALELDPKSGPAYDMLVSVYLATNRLEEAAREIEVVLSKAPRNQSALMTLASIREKQKDYPKARQAYEKLLAINPNFVPALNNLSYFYAEYFNQPDKAFELAQKARTLDPGNPAVADTLGWAAYKRGDYPQALTLLQESAAKLATNPEIQFHVGMAHYAMGQAKAARAAFQKAIVATEGFPSKAEAQSRLALLGDDSGAPRAMTVQQLQQLLEKQPNDIIARLRLAEAYERQNDWTKAAEAYEAALKVNPKLSSAALRLAQIYSGPAQNREKALAYAKMARSLSPNDRQATALLGRIAFEKGDFSWSYNLLQESSRALEPNAQILHDLAWAAYSLGKVDVAREAMESCLKASPTTETADDAKSFLAFTGQDAHPEKSTIASELKADPKYVPALMADAELDLESGNRGAAIDDWKQVLQRFPDFGPAGKRLALIYATDPARTGEAFELASEARKSLPDDPEVMQLLGRLNYERKDYTRAIQLLQESARKKPLDATGLYYLGLSQLAANQRVAGRQTLDQALAHGLKDPLAADARRALTTSGGR
jgi:tetratricopeptide (TPR) repeat protein